MHVCIRNKECIENEKIEHFLFLSVFFYGAKIGVICKFTIICDDIECGILGCISEFLKLWHFHIN